MAPRPDVSAERTEQIVEAAIAVFSRLGFHKARMDDIAREASLSKGTLYWYFESKDAITKALLQHLFEQEVQEVTTMLAAEGSVSERLPRAHSAARQPAQAAGAANRHRLRVLRDGNP